MTRNILITDGTGFIGSHSADDLIAMGYNVRVIDNLSEQGHAQKKKRPSYLNKEVELEEVMLDIKNLCAKHCRELMQYIILLLASEKILDFIPKVTLVSGLQGTGGMDS